MPVMQGFDCSFDDMAGCLEIRLPDAEIDDVVALRLECFGTCQDFEGGFCSQACQVLGGLQICFGHVVLSGSPANGAHYRRLRIYRAKPLTYFQWPVTQRS